jgi:hypothetical protein
MTSSERFRGCCLIGVRVASSRRSSEDLNLRLEPSSRSQLLLYRAVRKRRRASAELPPFVHRGGQLVLRPECSNHAEAAVRWHVPARLSFSATAVQGLEMATLAFGEPLKAERGVRAYERGLSVQGIHASPNRDLAVDDD